MSSVTSVVHASLKDGNPWERALAEDMRITREALVARVRERAIERARARAAGNAQHADQPDL